MLKHWTWPVLAVALAPVCAQAEEAQSDPSRNSVHEPLPLPAYPSPTDVPTPTFAPPALSSPAAGMFVLDDVQIATDPATNPPHALPEWQPAQAIGEDLALRHAHGQPLDAEWAAAQFFANGLLGHAVPFDRIWATIQLVNLAYAQNGYINSGIILAEPIAAGSRRLKLRLVYGELHNPRTGRPDLRIEWTGSRQGLNPAFIADRMPAAGARPINIKDLERDFRLLADNPFIRTIRTKLVPGVKPGEAALDITVTPQPRGDLYVTYGNSRSPSVGGERFAIGGSLRSLAVAGDTLGLEYGRTSGLDDVTGSYQMPFFSPDMTLRLRGAYNRAAVVDAPLLPLDIRSREWYAEGSLDRKLINRPLLPGAEPGRWAAAQDLAVGLTGVHRQTRSFLLGQPFSFTPGSSAGRTEYTAMRITANYSRRTPETVLAVSASTSLGLGGTHSGVPGQPDVGKHFTAAFVQANYARRLNRHQLELRLRLAGQVAGGTLYSAERLSVGGYDTVRGYRENVLFADEALLGSVELALPVRLAGRSASEARGRLATVVVSTFADGAVLRNRGTSQPAPAHIASLGVMLEWNPADWLRATGVFGQALNTVPPPGDRDLQDRGFAFRLIFRPLALLRR